MRKGWDALSKVRNMWKYPIRDRVFNYIRHYHSTNEKAWLKPLTASGVNEFKKLVQKSTVLVDKSLLIKDFLEDSGETLLITFPRRWGKSINIDMIKMFLSIEVNQNGELLPIEKRENHKLFLGGDIDLGFGKTKELKPLKISSNEAIMEYQGQFPVINIDFKSTKKNSFEVVYSQVKRELHKSF